MYSEWGDKSHFQRFMHWSVLFTPPIFLKFSKKSASLHSSSVLSCFLKLFVIVLLRRIFCTFLTIVRRPSFIVPTPVSFANDPRQNIHLVMKFCREFDADQVGGASPFPSGNQLHAVIIAAVLCCQGGTLQGQHGPDAVAGTGLIDLQFFFWPTCIFPAKVLPFQTVVDLCSAISYFGGVCARTRGKIIDYFVHVLL